MVRASRSRVTGMVRAAAVDLGPLRRQRNYRRVWVGQLIAPEWGSS